ncbi:MAG TPA: hypothetical protein PLA90_14830 [Candidatus Sumerlaeota bacterium]|nr:hypothetical protein [Candidatus Sumerlaeota bacterium]
MHWIGEYEEKNDQGWYVFYSKRGFMAGLSDDYDWRTNSSTQIASQEAAKARVEQDSLSALSSFRTDIIANDKKCKCIKKLLRP